MPLRPKDQKKRLNNSEEERPKNSSFDSCYDTMDDAKPAEDNQGNREDHLSGDEEDPDQFLSQLGLETEDLRKINNAQVCQITFTVMLNEYAKYVSANYVEIW